jgi:hypothetical protein
MRACWSVVGKYDEAIERRDVPEVEEQGALIVLRRASQKGHDLEGVTPTVPNLLSRIREGSNDRKLDKEAIGERTCCTSAEHCLRLTTNVVRPVHFRCHVWAHDSYLLGVSY